MSDPSLPSGTAQEALGNVFHVSSQEGGTLSFGNQVVTWGMLDAAAGYYVVGFIVGDLEGNGLQTFEEVTLH